MLPLDTCQWDSYILVVSDSPGFVNRSSVPSGVEMSHSVLPYVARLGVEEYQACVTSLLSERS